MKRVRFKPVQVKTVPDDRPTACPCCGGGILSTRGRAEKPVKDLRVKTVTARRCLCQNCERTFRRCPAGNRPQRAKPADARLGRPLVGARTSLCAASHALAGVGESLSHASVWRDVQEAGENARRSLAERSRGRVKAVGADETYVKVKGEERVVGLVTDAQTGQVLGLEALVEQDSDAFMDWIGECADEFGVEALVTDDLNTYKPAVEQLGLDHQICIAHALKWAWNRLGKIEGRDWIKARIWRLLRELPSNGDAEFLRLERLVRDDEDQTLRRPRVELSLSAAGRRGVGAPSPPARGAEREVAGAVVPPAAGGRSVDEQRDGAGDRQEQDKVQDCQWVQERIGTAERVWADATDMERTAWSCRS